MKVITDVHIFKSSDDIRTYKVIDFQDNKLKKLEK